MSMIIFMVIVSILSFQAFILFCCAAAGKDPVSQAISDQEQLEFLIEWKKKHKNHIGKKQGEKQ